jgi:nitric oxide reductase NorQ protein
MTNLNKKMIGTVVKVEKMGSRYIATDSDNNDYTSHIHPPARSKAFKNGNALTVAETSTGKLYWKAVPMDAYDATLNVLKRDESIEVPEGHDDTLVFIHDSYKLKPKGLVMNELKWKYLIRSAVRGKNIMMTGAAGSGKTMAAKSLVSALDRPDFYFNLGATQDPRSSLIGNTHFNKEDGTYFAESLFVKAIKTPDAVILLDEITRAHPDAWNILMTVLDPGQRYLRLDEADGSETVSVAPGVTFIATANIGNEYTATRVLDKALLDRFTIIEMDLLNETEESGLLGYMFPHVDVLDIDKVAKIAHLTRIEAVNENPRIDNGISTRTSVEIAGLLYDGFSLLEAADITIYPQYDATGGVDSERTFVKQIVQKFIDDGSSDELFTDEEVDEYAAKK